LCEKLSIDINDVCRDALKKEIDRRLSDEYQQSEKKKKSLIAARSKK
jgi:hypothetical protein